MTTRRLPTRPVVRPRAPDAARSRRTVWIVTLGATAVSTYALDAFATTVGGSLAASGLFGGLDQARLFAVLASTYLLWAAGLRANLASR